MKIKKILVNFPSNIGDVFMTLPALDMILAENPESRLTVVCTALLESLFRHHVRVEKIIVYNKRWPLRRKISAVKSMRGDYAFFIDFKHSLLPLIIRAQQRTPLLRYIPTHLHAVKRYQRLVRNLVKTQSQLKQSLFPPFLLPLQKKARFAQLGKVDTIFIATSSKSEQKQYPSHLLAHVVRGLVSHFQVCLIGMSSDVHYYAPVASIPGVIDFSGKTTLVEVWYLFNKYAKIVLCGDSGMLHLASYAAVPIVALFGPTSRSYYGPWSRNHKTLVNENCVCRPCRNTICKRGFVCLNIDPGRVIEEILAMINVSVT